MKIATDLCTVCKQTRKQMNGNSQMVLFSTQVTGQGDRQAGRTEGRFLGLAWQDCSKVRLSPDRQAVTPNMAEVH